MAELIQTPEDIRHLVDSFYQKVQTDALLGPVFNEIAQVDWAHHLPRMYGFWEKMLLGTGHFEGNPMRTHLDLNQKHPLTSEHFQRWLQLFEETIAENFEGQKAEIAIERAKSIATVMQSKIAQAKRHFS
ncbi:group III truncated hemoglobin [Cytophagales bacterium LB-30]|uniref:Group III truncated hemoglobin n=1 Tax=Shiella aurantiaca TaxID=3058365 RepID=A0ABT8F282_9BACT|nr:group III truncated hemoglobin [Shiella aurantiaca]MDN4164562.1 group III truncated hemoglobin [Shiella aurantiaca]